MAPCGNRRGQNLSEPKDHFYLISLKLTPCVGFCNSAGQKEAIWISVWIVSSWP